MMSSLRIVLNKILPGSLCIVFLVCSFQTEGEAHWNGTHQNMTDLVCETFRNDGRDQYAEFLNNIAPDKGRTYLDVLKQGVYDADLRVNGIYAVDKRCRDLSKSSCPESEKVANDIPEVIVGDHAFHPKTHKGRHSLDDAIGRVNKDWEEWTKDEKIRSTLLAVLPGGTPSEKKNNLLEIMQEANAVKLVEFFYSRALREWKNNHPGDAFYNLGIALHVLQDLTVPHHSKLITNDADYEKYVQEIYLPSIKVKPRIKGLYIQKSPSDWVRLVAGRSYDWSIDPSVSASKSFSLGVAATAGFLMDFFNDARINVNIVPKILSDRSHIFYYPWYYWERWKDECKGCPPNPRDPPQYIASNYYPKLGAYSSSDLNLIDTHMKWIVQTGAGVIVVSWWGKESREDKTLPVLLQAAQKYGLKIAFHIEPYKARTALSTKSDIQYIYEKYGNHPAFFRIIRPTKYNSSTIPLGVFYIFDISFEFKPENRREMLESWGKMLDSIRGTKFNAIVIGQTTDPTLIDQAHFDGIYTYDAYRLDGATFKKINDGVVARDSIFAPSVGPGYIDERAKHGIGESKDRKFGRTYDEMWEKAIESQSEWITITSFNEWHEGTQIEPATIKTVEKFPYLNYENHYGKTGEPAEFSYIQRTQFWVKNWIASKSLEISPTVSMTPSSGIVGTTFEETGKGFTANSTTTLYGRRPDGSVWEITKVNIDSSGAFFRKWTAQAPGNNFAWWAIDNSTGKKSNEIVYSVAPAPVTYLSPDLPTSISQYRSDGATPIGFGATTNESTVVFKCKATDPNNDTVKLQIELRRVDEYGGQFTGNPTKESAIVSSGSTITISVYGLINGSYHWRLRTINSKGITSNWVSAGDNPDSVADFIVSAAPSPTPTISPTLTMSPPSGPVGTKFMLTGNGFTPSGKVTIYFRDTFSTFGGAVNRTTSTADSSGGFSLTEYSYTYNFPTWAVDNSTGKKSNEVVFNITPAPSTNPQIRISTNSSGPWGATASGQQGATFYIKGSGFSANAVVQYNVRKPDGSMYPPSDFTGKVDGAGNFNHIYTSQCTTPVGTYTVWVTDRSSAKNTNTVSEIITLNPNCTAGLPTPVSPTVNMSPPSGDRNTIFTLTGKGFTPNGKVSLYMKMPPGFSIKITMLTADSSGGFSRKDYAPGNKYSWWAVDDSTGKKSNEIVYNINP